VSCNNDQPHVHIFPEDDANRQLALGFSSHVDSWPRQMQVVDVAGGWNEVLKQFKSDHVKYMDRFPQRFMVLLIDFDAKKSRLGAAQRVVPPHLAERVFVLGAWTQPEALRAALGSYADIGSALAADCRDGTDKTWRHGLLQHNASELVRLRKCVRSIFFSVP
jgi:hypothetical protein